MNQPTITVALADDHTFVRQGIISFLNKEENIRVIADAPNGAELLNAFRQLSSLPDIVILDINMPLMDGYTTASEIRNLYPTIKTIAFSLHGDEFNIIRMIKSGAVGYLNKKEHSIDDICLAIKQVVEKGHCYFGNISEELWEKANNIVLPELTDKESQFLALCCDGLSNKEIGDQMFVSYRTVEHYYESLSKKLGVTSRVGLVAFALKRGLVAMGQ